MLNGAKDGVPFKKGYDARREGNGRKKIIPSLAILVDQVLGEKKNDKMAIVEIMKALRSKAIKGDVRAAELLLNRAYGKAEQKISLEGEMAITWNEVKTYDDPNQEAD